MKTALLFHGDLVTVATLKLEATGPLSDLKALIRKVKGGGKTILVLPVTRETNVFDQEASLQGYLDLRRTKHRQPEGGIITRLPNSEQPQVLTAQALDHGQLRSLQLTLRTAGLTPTAVIGLIEAAARTTGERSVILHVQGDVHGTGEMGLNMPEHAVVINNRIQQSDVAAGLFDRITQAIEENGANTAYDVRLLGEYAPYAEQLAQQMQSFQDLGVDVNVQAMTPGMIAQAALRAPTPGLGQLCIPLVSAKTFEPKQLLVPGLAAAVLGISLLTLNILTGRAQQTTTDTRAQTETYARVAAQAQVLKTENDTTELNLRNAQQLAEDRGPISKDLRQLARTLAAHNARISTFDGPGAPGNIAAFDGIPVRNIYIVKAQTTSRQNAEELIEYLNLEPYASNVLSVRCNERGCAMDMQVGFRVVPVKPPEPPVDAAAGVSTSTVSASTTPLPEAQQ